MAEDTGSAPETPEYGTAPVGPSLAWTDMKRDDVKAFMKIDQVLSPHPRAAPLPEFLFAPRPRAPRCNTRCII